MKKIILLLMVPFFLKAVSISGHIIDHNRKPLSGVNVFIKGHKYGDATDEYGFYKITWIFPGKYDISFSYIGQKHTLVKKVTVGLLRNTTVDVKLEKELFNGDVIEIKYDRNREGR